MGNQAVTQSWEDGADLRPDALACDPETALEALGRPVMREILACTRRPKTVDEISSACDIPLSTVYRNVRTLHSLGLLEEGLRVTGDGDNPAEYEALLDTLTVSFEAEAVEIDCTRN